MVRKRRRARDAVETNRTAQGAARCVGRKPRWRLAATPAVVRFARDEPLSGAWTSAGGWTVAWTRIADGESGRKRGRGAPGGQGSRRSCLNGRIGTSSEAARHDWCLGVPWTSLTRIHVALKRSQSNTGT